VAQRKSTLAREIRQTKPFRSPRHEAGLGLLKTADLLREAGSRILEPFAVTDQQYNVLRILRGAGKSGLPTLEIADRMIERAPGITRLIDRLAKKGLVVRRRCETDRRQVYCLLAPAGARLLARMDGPVARLDRRLAMLGDPEVDTLIRLLDAIRAGLSRSTSPRHGA
jgi:DNA-binding MarR family transcriptional regulator